MVRTTSYANPRLMTARRKLLQALELLTCNSDGANVQVRLIEQAHDAALSAVTSLARICDGSAEKGDR